MLLFAKRLLVSAVSAALLLNPVMAAAGDAIVVDPAAAAANRASLDKAANGVPVVNIVAPTTAGVSHNKFLDFNVTQQGLILNNSRTIGTSQLGGVVMGNANLSGGEARLILNEVTGSNQSELRGATEIFGRRAEYILANPNGITCDGCGFINTPRATLTTGTPQMTPDGGLGGFDVNGGAVVIQGGALDVTGLDFFDIVSRTASLNATLHGNEVGVHTGRNTFDYASRTATAKAANGQPAPSISIDSSLLGGMYADRITLVGTEAGVGVNMQGEMIATSDLTLTTDGRIAVRDLNAGTDIKLASAAGEVAVDGTAYAGRDLSVGGGAVTIAGTTGAANDVTIQGTTVTNTGKVVAGLASDGTVVAETGKLAVTADTLSNNGLLHAGKETSLDSGHVDNQAQGVVAALGDVTVSATILDNAGKVSAGKATRLTATTMTTTGTIAAGTGLTVTADTMQASGTVAAAETATIKTGELDLDGTLAAKNTAVEATRRITVASTGVAAGTESLSLAGHTLAVGGRAQSDGTVTLTASDLALTGEAAAGTSLNIAADTLTVSGTATAGTNLTVNPGSGVITVSSSGVLAADGDVTVNATALANAGGISAGGTLAISGDGTVENLASGRMVAVGDATLESTGGNLRQSGFVASGQTLTLKGPRIETVAGGTTAGRTVELDGGTLALGGRVQADEDLTTASAQDTTVAADGEIVAGAKVSQTAGTTLDINGKVSGQTVELSADGKLSGGAGSRISATDLATITKAAETALAGAVEATDVTITTAGPLATAASGSITAHHDLTVSASAIDNAGRMEAGNRFDFGLTGTMRNAATGSLTSAGTGESRLAAVGVDNAGSVATRGALRVAVPSFANAGSFTTGGDLFLLGLTDFTNTDLVFAGGDLTVEALHDILNDGGTLLAGGDIVLGGAAGARARSILNRSGSIETADGDIVLRAGTVTNMAPGGTATTTTTISDQTYQDNHSVGRGPCTIGGTACKGEYWRSWSWVPNPTGTDAGAWYGSSNGLWVRSRVLETGSVGGTEAAIFASRHLIVEADGIVNENSTITSGGDMTLTGDTLTNVGSQTTRSWYISAGSSTMTRCYGGACSGFGNGGGTTLMRSWVQSQQGGKIVAGGAFSGSFTGRVDNSTITQFANAPVGAHKVRIDQLQSDRPAPLTGEIDLIAQAALDDSPLPATPPAPVTLGDLSAELARQVAGFGSLFRPAPPASPFLYESRVQFTDLGSFYGSDYFLSRVSGYTPEELPKRLGDAYLETRLVRDAVVEQTGQRWLNPDYGSDAAQMKALLDNAIDVGAVAGLSVGQALSPEQIAALDRDIIWYVETVIDGQTVLVPRLYLASASRERITTDGALIAANDNLTVTSGATIANDGGAIASAKDVALLAQDSIVNASGKIKAGGDIDLTALTGDVVNVTKLAELKKDGSDVSDVRIGRGSIEAGGDLAVTAGRDIAMTGADMAAGGTADLAAGRDVVLGANALRHEETGNRATIGGGTIIIRSDPSQGIEGLNRDLAKAQEITRDTKTEVSVIVPVPGGETAKRLEEVGTFIGEVAKKLEAALAEAPPAATKAQLTPEEIKKAVADFKKTLILEGVNQGSDEGNFSAEEAQIQQEMANALTGVFAYLLENGVDESTATAVILLKITDPALRNTLEDSSREALADNTLTIGTEPGLQKVVLPLVIAGIVLTAEEVAALMGLTVATVAVLSKPENREAIAKAAGNGPAALAQTIDNILQTVENNAGKGGDGRDLAQNDNGGPPLDDDGQQNQEPPKLPVPPPSENNDQTVIVDSNGNALAGDWSATATLTAPENALSHWSKHAAEFPEYGNAGQYVQAAQNFVNTPLSGTLTKIRPNGDTLLYDPSSNTFAVKTITGVPRTMFRPTDGINYWNKQ